MEKKLEIIDAKVDKLDERLDLIEKVLIKQEVNIDHHIRRTNLLEEVVELMREEMKPVEKHVYYMHGAMKALGVLSLLLGIVLLVKKLIF